MSRHAVALAGSAFEHLQTLPSKRTRIRPLSHTFRKAAANHPVARTAHMSPPDTWTVVELLLDGRTDWFREHRMPASATGRSLTTDANSQCTLSSPPLQRPGSSMRTALLRPRGAQLNQLAVTNARGRSSVCLVAQQNRRRDKPGRQGRGQRRGHPRPNPKHTEHRPYRIGGVKFHMYKTRPGLSPPLTPDTPREKPTRAPN